MIFHDTAKKHGVKPILGCEVYVAPGDRRTKSGTPGETANHLVLLAENNEGYHNLIKLVSAGYTEGFYYKPRIDKDLLAQHARGLIGLSSCLKGEVAEGLRRDQVARARDRGGRVPGHPRARRTSSSRCSTRASRSSGAVNAGVPSIAADLGLGMVVTNDVHYLRRDDFKPHDILLCIGTGKTVDDAHRLRYHGDQFYLKTPAEMLEVFRDFPDAIANTVRIADRCAVNLDSKENYLPRFEVPSGFTLDELLRARGAPGLRAAPAPVARTRGAGRAEAHARGLRRRGSRTRSR